MYGLCLCSGVCWGGGGVEVGKLEQQTETVDSLLDWMLSLFVSQTVGTLPAGLALY